MVKTGLYGRVWENRKNVGEKCLETETRFEWFVLEDTPNERFETDLYETKTTIIHKNIGSDEDCPPGFICINGECYPDK